MLCGQLPALRCGAGELWWDWRCLGAGWDVTAKLGPLDGAQPRVNTKTPPRKTPNLLVLGAASRSRTLPRAGIASLGQEATAPGPSGCSGVLVVLRSTGSTRICCFGVVFFCHSSGAERGCSGKERNPEGWHRIKTRPLLTPSPPQAVSQAAPDFLPKCDFSQPEKSSSPSPTAYQSDSHPVTACGVFFFGPSASPARWGQVQVWEDCGFIHSNAAELVCLFFLPNSASFLLHSP